MIRVVLSPEAEADALAAFGTTKGVARDLAERFRDHLGRAFARLQDNPEEAPVVYRKLVQRFPYVVLYQLLPGVLYVVGVMHTKQKPATWKRRAP